MFLLLLLISTVIQATPIPLKFIFKSFIELTPSVSNPVNHFLSAYCNFSEALCEFDNTDSFSAQMLVSAHVVVRNALNFMELDKHFKERMVDWMQSEMWNAFLMPAATKYSTSTDLVLFFRQQLSVTYMYRQFDTITMIELAQSCLLKRMRSIKYFLLYISKRVDVKTCEELGNVLEELTMAVVEVISFLHSKVAPMIASKPEGTGNMEYIIYDSHKELTVEGLKAEALIICSRPFTTNHWPTLMFDDTLVSMDHFYYIITAVHLNRLMFTKTGKECIEMEYLLEALNEPELNKKIRLIQKVNSVGCENVQDLFTVFAHTVHPTRHHSDSVQQTITWKPLSDARDVLNKMESQGYVVPRPINSLAHRLSSNQTELIAALYLIAAISPVLVDVLAEQVICTNFTLYILF